MSASRAYRELLTTLPGGSVGSEESSSSEDRTNYTYLLGPTSAGHDDGV